jgi:hypothetical protein
MGGWIDRDRLDRDRWMDGWLVMRVGGWING